jgi:hypothetical protein
MTLTPLFSRTQSPRQTKKAGDHAPAFLRQIPPAEPRDQCNAQSSARMICGVTIRRHMVSGYTAA